MKKHYSLLFAFFMAFLSLLVSCDEIENYKITIISTEGGKAEIYGTIETSVYVPVDNWIQVSAVSDDGYGFVGWFIGDDSEPVSTEEIYVFKAKKDVTLTAKFAKFTTLSLRAEGCGTVSIKDLPETSITALAGTEVAVVATPEEFYEFIGWFIGDSDTPVSTDAEYTFTLTESVVLTAKFKNYPSVSIKSTKNGTVSFKDSSDDAKFVLPGTEVTIVATPDKDCDFVGWFIDDAETAVSTDAEYTFIVNENVSLTAKFVIRPINGYEWVNLGLPSGIKWATHNVGATKPGEYGSYYAWGETEEKEYYDWSTYKWCNGSENTITKYCTDSNYGSVDNRIELDLEDDVASVKWGGSWRMSTFVEVQELLIYCTWRRATLNGVTGYYVTGLNGNSIFLPATGYRYGDRVEARGSYGYYWSSSLSKNDGAFIQFSSEVKKGWSTFNRCVGVTVRPVSE